MNVSLNASSRMLLRLVPTLACVAILNAGCSQQKIPPQQGEADKQVLAADSLHMARRYAQWRQEVQSLGARRNDADSLEMPIDLSDEAQYRFVKNRLQAAGNSPENSPQLFRRIEKALKDKKSGLPSRKTRKDRLTATTGGESEGSAWCGHLLPLTDVASSDTSVARFQASGLVTCFDGSDYTYADVTAFATNPEQTQFRMLGSQSFEEYASVVLETPPLELSLEVNPGEVLLVDSMAMAFDEATGESHLSYAVAESSLVALSMQEANHISVDHPRELIGRHLSDNPIRTCLERGAITGYLDCDYTSGSKDPVTGLFKPFAAPHTGIAAVDPSASQSSSNTWVAAPDAYWEAPGGYDITHLYLPTSGSYRVTLPPQCTLDTINSTVNLILMERGGRCSAGTAPGSNVLRGSLPFQEPSFDGAHSSRLVVPFDGLLDFGPDCLNMFQNVRLVMRATLKATCASPTTGGTWTYTRSRYQDVVNLDWRNACLAEGTQVVKADGTRVGVEQVKLGDKLLANGEGLALTVTSVSRGSERKPMVKLRDVQGSEVLVTETHPMVTATRGVVQAGDLKVGDALLTRTGSARLVGVERVPYSGQVFNFALGTPEELSLAGAQARTLYANGFLVGDSQMQTELEKQRTLDARQVLSRLDGAWHEDFRHHQARQKSARR